MGHQKCFIRDATNSSFKGDLITSCVDRLTNEIWIILREIGINHVCTSWREMPGELKGWSRGGIIHHKAARAPQATSNHCRRGLIRQRCCFLNCRYTLSNKAAASVMLLSWSARTLTHAHTHSQQSPPRCGHALFLIRVGLSSPSWALYGSFQRLCILRASRVSSLITAEHAAHSLLWHEPRSEFRWRD